MTCPMYGLSQCMDWSQNSRLVLWTNFGNASPELGLPRGGMRTNSIFMAGRGRIRTPLELVLSAFHGGQREGRERKAVAQTMIEKILLLAGRPDHLQGRGFGCSFLPRSFSDFQTPSVAAQLA